MASTTISNVVSRRPFICESCLKHHLRLSRLRQRVASPYLGAASFSSLAPARQCPSSISSHSTRRLLVTRNITKQTRFAPLRRAYSTPSPVTESAASGLAPLPHRRLVSLSGPDAAKFLQGLVTNNVDPSRQTPFYSAFLDARGRVLWDVFIWTYPELIAEKGSWSCFIEVDAGEADALVKHLRRHKLRSKIQIEVLKEGDIGVWAAWGLSQEQLQSEQLVASLVDPRGRDFGTRLLYKGDQAPQSSSAPTVDPSQYQLRRYLYGIPEGPHEIPRENALPMECNIDLSQGIDFRKGCYVGQELTIRTKHTGVVRKRILPVQLYSASTPSPPSDLQHATFEPEFSAHSIPETGADIKQLDEEGGIKKGRAAGKFLAGVGNVGLALCRLEMMTSMRVSAGGGSWKPGVEFGIQLGENGEVARVKAIVPQWFRERERDVWNKNRTRV